MRRIPLFLPLIFILLKPPVTVAVAILLVVVPVVMIINPALAPCTLVRLRTVGLTTNATQSYPTTLLDHSLIEPTCIQYDPVVTRAFTAILLH